jgi:hypothetical protein
MVTIKIRGNSKQAKAVVKMLETFDFVEIENQQIKEKNATSKIINKQEKTFQPESSTELELVKQEKLRVKELIEELKTGEKSKFVSNFDFEENLKNLQIKHLANEL